MADQMQRGRSRSGPRLGSMPELTRAALDVVFKRDADRRVEDQRATIAELRQQLNAKTSEADNLREQLILKTEEVAALHTRNLYLRSRVTIGEDTIDLMRRVFAD